jgi:hypothetical protein
MKPQYPTKNLLQNFKGAHLSYLRSKMSERELKCNQGYAVLEGRNCMSMQAYVELYSTPAFEVLFEEMFASRYLHRAMMLSRSELLAKRNHSKKIAVFEEAFRSKKFTNIN